MPIVLIENTARADRVTTRFAKVLDFLVDVARAARKLARVEGEAALSPGEGGVLLLRVAIVLHVFEDVKELLVLVEAFQVLGLDWLAAVFVGALLRVASENLGHAELAKRVPAVWHDQRLALFERVRVLTPLALE